VGRHRTATSGHWRPSKTPGTLHHVLAEGRHTSQSRTIKPAYLIAGGVVALVAVVGILILVTGGKDSPLVPGHGSEAPTPFFTFTTEKTAVITTGPPTTQDPNATPNKQKATQAGVPAAANAKAMLHGYYTQAFLVPDNWMNGSYDDAFIDFSDQAKAQAQHHLPALTAGTNAGDTYSSIKPTKSTLKTRVLLDANYQPYAVACTIVFNADATKKTGGTVVMVSQGRFILEKVGAKWQITSYTVNRADRSEPVASGSGAATPSGSAS
jgi:hypothetical protein